MQSGGARGLELRTSALTYHTVTYHQKSKYDLLKGLYRVCNLHYGRGDLGAIGLCLGLDLGLPQSLGGDDFTALSAERMD